jgi:two-component system response regulator BaeR
VSKTPGRISLREQLIDNTYDDNSLVGDRTIDRDIEKSRKKLTEISLELELIPSVFGVGYRVVLA